MQNQLESKAYAGFFVRFVAYGIDMLIASIVVGMVKIPFSIAASGGVNFLKSNFIFEYSVLDVLGYVGIAAYFVLLTYFAHTTIGKMLFHLEVTCEEKWTFINILYRETVGRFLSSLLDIGYLAVIVQKEKQGFHDMLCDTHVVYKNMFRREKETAFKDVSPKPEETFRQEEQAEAGTKQPVEQQNLQPAPEQGEEQKWTYYQSKQESQQEMVSAFELTESNPVETEPENIE